MQVNWDAPLSLVFDEKVDDVAIKKKLKENDPQRKDYKYIPAKGWLALFAGLGVTAVAGIAATASSESSAGKGLGFLAFIAAVASLAPPIYYYFCPKELKDAAPAASGSGPSSPTQPQPTPTENEFEGAVDGNDQNKKDIASDVAILKDESKLTNDKATAAENLGNSNNKAARKVLREMLLEVNKKPYSDDNNQIIGSIVYSLGKLKDYGAEDTVVQAIKANQQYSSVVLAPVYFKATFKDKFSIDKSLNALVEVLGVQKDVQPIDCLVFSISHLGEKEKSIPALEKVLTTEHGKNADVVLSVAHGLGEITGMSCETELAKLVMKPDVHDLNAAGKLGLEKIVKDEKLNVKRDDAKDIQQVDVAKILTDYAATQPQGKLDFINKRLREVNNRAIIVPCRALLDLETQKSGAYDQNVKLTIAKITDTLVSCKDVNSFPTFVELLGHREASVRECAAYGIRMFAEYLNPSSKRQFDQSTKEKVCTKLIERLDKDKDVNDTTEEGRCKKEIIGNSLYALAELKDKKATSAVITFLATKPPEALHTKCLKTLSSIGDPQAIISLVGNGLISNVEKHRTIAAKGLESIINLSSLDSGEKIARFCTEAHVKDLSELKRKLEEALASQALKDKTGEVAYTTTESIIAKIDEKLKAPKAEPPASDDATPVPEPTSAAVDAE